MKRGILWVGRKGNSKDSFGFAGDRFFNKWMPNQHLFLICDNLIDQTLFNIKKDKLFFLNEEVDVEKYTHAVFAFNAELVTKENYKKILSILSPVIPHFASECLEDLKIDHKVKWPIVEKQFLINENINIVIQINGKKRSIINCKKGITEENIMKIIKDDMKVNKFIDNKKNIKSIFIKDKLLNLIVKE